MEVKPQNTRPASQQRSKAWSIDNYQSYVSYSLSKGTYIGDYIRDIKGDTRSLDYSLCRCTAPLGLGYYSGNIGGVIQG